MSAVRISVASQDRLFSEGLCQILLCDPSFVVTVHGDASEQTHTDFDIRIVDAGGDLALPAVPAPPTPTAPPRK